MFILRRLVYYFISIVTLLRDVRNWPALLRLVRPGVAPVTLRLRDGSQYAVRSLMDAWAVKESHLDRNYERYGVPIQDGWTIVDIGAALGDFTVFAARRAPHGRVYAYEPAPDSVALLERNLALNGISNVTVYPNAVASKAGALTLDVSGGVAVQYRTVGTSGGAANGRISVQALALSEVLAALPGGSCDLLKMDCEGAEYEMLLDSDVAVLQRVKRICLEYHEFVTPYSHTDLVQMFQERGWQVRVSPNRVRRELGFLYAVAPDGD